MNDRLVKIGEAAKILGVHPQTLRRWEEGGMIQPAKRTPKGTRLYSLHCSECGFEADRDLNAALNLCPS